MVKRSGIILAILFFVVGAVWIHPLSAQEEKPTSQPSSSSESTAEEVQGQPPVISKVVVKGNQIISTSTILNKVKTHEGDIVRQETINQDVKNLYATGFFKDVKFNLEMEGSDRVRVEVVVEEKPIIKQIAIEGSSIFKVDTLRRELNLSEGQILDPKALQEGVNAIRSKYLDKGFKFVDVKSEVDVNEQAREASVFVLISEGDKFKIKDIRYEGVKAFKVRQIARLVKTRKKEWFFSGVFKEDKFNEDLERIQAFYQSKGYLDASVDSQFDYDYKAKQIVITIKVDEGKQYTTGALEFKGNAMFPKSEIETHLKMKPGTPYSQHYLRQDIEAIRQYYFDRGYIAVSIAPDVKLNRSTGRVDVFYELAEGDLYYVEKVKIRGNRKTKDNVIRRELRVRPGERFDGQKLERSKKRLENLDYFEEVNYETEQGSSPDKRDVVFRVKEKQTGELSFGAGFSSIDQFVGFAEISQRNFDLLNFPAFTGAGQKVSLRGRLGSKTKDVDFNFTEPYLLGSPYSLGVNIYWLDRSAIHTDFDTLRRGLSLNLGKQFTDAVRGSLGYTIEHVRLDNLSDEVTSKVDGNGDGDLNDPEDVLPPSDVRETAAGRWLGRLKFGLSRDTRDSAINPTTGWLLSGQIELVGVFLGGQDNFYDWILSATRWWTFKTGHTLEFKNRLGVMSTLGSTGLLPVSERFYAGGLGTIRGYQYRMVGPKQFGEAIGGKTLFITNLEYTFPIFASFRGCFFMDAGEVNYDSYKLGATDFGIGIGPGVKLNTPIGPVALYYGIPLTHREEDNKGEFGRFEFSLSRSF